MTNIVLKIPKGAAREYAPIAVSIYRRCNNGCIYCYNDRGPRKAALGSGTPELKTCFKNEEAAITRFKRELLQQRDELSRIGGIFFSFITDPCLPETIASTMECSRFAMENGVPVTILTKCTDWVNDTPIDKWPFVLGMKSKLLCVGFTLTGHDEMEPKASPNAERIRAMRALHEFGIKTFASIEPIVDFDASAEMVEQTFDCCDLYKIGLMSGVKKDYYSVEKACLFVGKVQGMLARKGSIGKVYWKNSIRSLVGEPVMFDHDEHTVTMDYNIFGQ